MKDGWTAGRGRARAQRVGYLLECVEILPLLSRGHGEGMCRRNVCRKKSKEFLFKVLTVR